MDNLNVFLQFDFFCMINHINKLYFFPVQYESALVFDAVLLFAKALRELSRDKVFIPANVSCDGEEVWRSGKDLYDYLQKVRNIEGHIV